MLVLVNHKQKGSPAWAGPPPFFDILYTSNEQRIMMIEQLYKYIWSNNAKRKTMQGRTCRVLGRLARNSCVIEFTDNGQREIVSRNALRKDKRR